MNKDVIVTNNNLSFNTILQSRDIKEFKLLLLISTVTLLSKISLASMADSLIDASSTTRKKSLT